MPGARTVAAGKSTGAGRILEELARGHPFPLSCHLVLTEHCNFRCPHCFLVHRRPEQPLSLAELETVLHELAGLGTLFLGLTGGEATLHPELSAIVELAVAERFYVTLTSNGFLLSEPTIRSLRERGLSALRVSLYALSAEPHDDLVGRPGAWQQSVSALEEFARLGGRASVSYLLLGQNSGDLAHLERFCEERGLGYQIDTTVVVRNDGDRGPLAYRAGAQEVKKALGNPAFMDLDSLGVAEPRAAISALCTAGVDSPAILPNGDVRLCQRLPWILGNIREESFATIWTGSERRREFVGTRWRDLPECSRCELSALCARCPASALLETGDWLGVSPGDCERARALADLLGIRSR